MTEIGLTHKKRIEYIDAMRGFTMLLVVFGHVLTHCLRNYSEDSVVYCFFERFRMPMFFFISGYIAYKAAEHWDFSLFRTMLKKKAIVQLIPTFIFFSFWGIVYNNNLCEIFMKNGTDIFWFCQALFEMFVIYYTVQLISHYTSTKTFNYLIISIAIATKILNVNNFGLYDENDPWFRMTVGYRVLPYFMYFVLGLMAKKYHKQFIDLMKNDGAKAFFILAYISLFCLNYHHDFAGGAIINKLSYSLVLRVVGVLCVFSFFCNHADYFAQNNRVSKYMQFVGRRTLDIYLLHYFFLPDLAVCNEFLSTNTRALLELSFGIGISLMVIMVCLLCSTIIRSSDFLGHYLFGAKSEKYK